MPIRESGGSKRLNDSREKVIRIMNSMKRGHAPIEKL